LEFITKKRQKVKLGPFIHHPIPEIEAYANQTEWVEGTLVDQDNTGIDVENDLIDLEKQLDDNYFLQVLEELETVMSTPPIIQTPQNEEKIPKRNREGVSTSRRATSDFQQESNKRQRLNPTFEQEYTKDSSEVTNTGAKRSRPTTPSGGMQEPSTSQTQMFERHLNVEVSSFRVPTDKDQDIKERYKEMKARNERLKAQTYAQYLKLTTTNQTRLMSAFDIKEGKMQMTFMKPTTQQPETASDFKRVDFEVLARDIHPTDHIKLHKQAGKMI